MRFSRMQKPRCHDCFREMINTTSERVLCSDVVSAGVSCISIGAHRVSQSVTSLRYLNFLPYVNPAWLSRAQTFRQVRSSYSPSVSCKAFTARDPRSTRASIEPCKYPTHCVKLVTTLLENGFRPILRSYKIMELPCGSIIVQSVLARSLTHTSSHYACSSSLPGFGTLGRPRCRTRRQWVSKA